MAKRSWRWPRFAQLGFMVRVSLLVCILFLLRSPTIGAQGPSTFELVYDPQASTYGKANIRWPSFMQPDPYDEFVWDAGVPVDEWVLSLTIDWTTGQVRGTMTGQGENRGSRLDAFYGSSCWVERAGECKVAGEFRADIVQGYIEPYGEDGKAHKGWWRICFVAKGTIGLEGQMRHKTVPWTEKVEGEAVGEWVTVSHEESAPFQEFFSGALLPADGEDRTTPEFLLMTERGTNGDAWDPEAGPSLTDIGPLFVLNRGTLPAQVPSPGPEMGICEATGDAWASGEASPQEGSDTVSDPDGAAEKLQVSASFYPDPPVPGKVVVFQAQVTGQASGETLHYAWYLDGELLGTQETAEWTATLGEHTLTLEVQSAADAERGAAATVSWWRSLPRLPIRIRPMMPASPWAP